MEHLNPFLTAVRRMDDDRIIAGLLRLRGAERRQLAAQLALIAELDDRKTYAERGHTSLFVYCQKVLGFSDDEAGKRIYAARAAARFPKLYDKLYEGALHLSAIVRIAGHLTPENQEALIDKACGKTVREIDFLLAEMYPREPRMDMIRAENYGSKTYHGRTQILPMSPSSIRFAFSGSPRLLEMIDEARARLRHKHPEGRLDSIMEEALSALLAKTDPGRGGGRPRDKRPAKNQVQRRDVPRDVEREVWKRDKGRCVYRAIDGVVCGSKAWLEIDHVIPWSMGGQTTTENLRLLCRTHNQLMAKRLLGNRAGPPTWRRSPGVLPPGTINRRPEGFSGGADGGRRSGP